MPGRKDVNMKIRMIRRVVGPTRYGAHGTWDRDRVPMAGVVGRESKHLHLMVCHHSNRATLQP